MSQQFGLFEKGAFRDALSLVGGGKNNTLAPRKWEKLWLHDFKALYATSATAHHLTHHTYVTEFTRPSVLSGLWNWWSDGKLLESCLMKVRVSANHAARLSACLPAHPAHPVCLSTLSTCLPE